MLQLNKFYHIYNHANGNENLFLEEKNYLFFLQKMEHHLCPYMKIYAYCLMPNHFHIVARTKDAGDFVEGDERFESLRKLTKKDAYQFLQKKVSKSLSNLCNSYAQAFNKMYRRRGSLFMPNFKFKLIEDDMALRRSICYVHNNPIHHGFTGSITAWSFSSYQFMLTLDTTFLQKEEVLGLFGGKDIFLKIHENHKL